MWIVLTLLGCFSITVAHTFIKIYGTGIISYLVYCLIACGIAGWVFPLIYKIAPSFFQAWFLSQAVYSVLGYISSLLILSENISLPQIVGSILVFVGSILLM